MEMSKVKKDEEMSPLTHHFKFPSIWDDSRLRLVHYTTHVLASSGVLTCSLMFAKRTRDMSCHIAAERKGRSK